MTTVNAFLSLRIKKSNYKKYNSTFLFYKIDFKNTCRHITYHGILTDKYPYRSP